MRRLFAGNQKTVFTVALLAWLTMATVNWAATITVDNVASLGTTRAGDGDIAETRGYSVRGVGAARYVYHLTGRTTHTEDGVLYFDGVGADGYWELLHDGVIDVTQAGAVPGGSAAANATAIQRALDASGDTATMRLSPGTYQIDDRLYMDNKSYVVDGYGATLEIVSDGTGAGGATDLDYKNFWQNRNNTTPVGSFILKGLTIQDTANASAEWKALLQLEKCGYTLIEDCVFIDTSTTAIQVGSRAISMVAGTQGEVIINKCRCYNTDPASFIGGNFAKIEDATSFSFTKNICRDMSRSVTLELASDRDIDKVIITGNTFDNSKVANKSATQTAIPIHVNAQFAGCEIDSLVISNNIVRNTDTSGTASQGAAIYVASFAVGQIKSTAITGNAIQRCLLTGKENASFVVYIVNLQQMTFGNNSIQGTEYTDEFEFTVDAGTDVVTSTGHNLTDGTPVVLTTTDTLPDPLSVSTVYYVRDRTGDTFKLTATSGGAAIDITDTGTGTHSINAIYRGILVQGCKESIISNNTIDGDFDRGLYVWNTTYSIVIGNLFSGTYSTGGEIVPSGATGTNFANNYANGVLVN